MKDFHYPFEKLLVFQKSRALAKMIYELTKNFPADEKFGLVSQMRRAAVSIVSNLAEGGSRISKKEQARFTEISYSSAAELLAQTMISVDLCFLKPDDYEISRINIAEITSMLSGLRKSQTNDVNEPDSPYLTF